MFLSPAGLKPSGFRKTAECAVAEHNQLKARARTAAPSRVAKTVTLKRNDKNTISREGLGQD